MLVDTDIIIWYMRDNKRAVKLLDNNTGFNISVITYMELVQGMRNNNELKSLKMALNYWKTKIVQINEIISSKAMIYQEQFFLSNSLQLADALIASTALTYQLPLHTGNTKHYRMFKDLVIHNF